MPMSRLPMIPTGSTFVVLPCCAIFTSDPLVSLVLVRPSVEANVTAFVHGTMCEPPPPYFVDVFTKSRIWVLLRGEVMVGGKFHASAAVIWTVLRTRL
ncbi:unnamed protein product [Hydatigera taeniaeformis]|uniref:Uncharacterized protein n=1 Tax=Hydatigena taeniaeformis TaxID=6205 RepID=A0A3P7G2L1_HYDTA|nr:unnamed protein product [Hydatigera taeniaeformis]